MKKRLLASLLCVVMILGMVPTAALATETPASTPSGTNTLGNPTGSVKSTGDAVYYGGKPWYVLSTEHDADGSDDTTNDKGILLLSRYAFSYRIPWMGYADGAGNDGYLASDIRGYLNGKNASSDGSGENTFTGFRIAASYGDDPSGRHYAYYYRNTVGQGETPSQDKAYYVKDETITYSSSPVTFSSEERFNKAKSSNELYTCDGSTYTPAETWTDGSTQYYYDTTPYKKADVDEEFSSDQTYYTFKKVKANGSSAVSTEAKAYYYAGYTVTPLTNYNGDYNVNTSLSGESTKYHNFAIDLGLTEADKAAILETSRDEAPKLDKDTFFLLSLAEATSNGYGLNTDDSRKAYYVGEYSIANWWLRSANGEKIYYINQSGERKSDYWANATSAGIRPAFNLNPENVLFTSAVDENGYGKANLNGGFSMLASEETSTYKLTLKDNSAAPTCNLLRIDSDGNYNIYWTDGPTENNGKDYISAIIKDSADNIYGYIKLGREETGSATFKLPEGISGLNEPYTLYLFNEECNGDTGTDYASNLTAACTVSTVQFNYTEPTNLTYDGSPKTATVTAQNVGNVAVNYYDQQGNKVENATTVGTYTVKIDVSGGSDLGAVSNVTDPAWKFTIAPATATDVTTPVVVNSITYGTKLSEVSLDNGWQWENGETVPTVSNNGYQAYYEVTDYTNYDWSSIEGYVGDTHRVVRTVALTVTAVEPTYNVPANLTATYGETLAEVRLPSGWAWSNATTSVGDVGTRSFSATYTHDDTGNYTPMTNDLTVTVEPKEVGLDWSLAGGTLAYDGAAKIFTATATDLVGTDNISVTVALNEGENNIDVGSFTYAATGLTGEKATCYKLPNNVTKTETITQRTLTVTPNGGLSKVYGEIDPTMTYSYSGQVAGQTPAFNDGTLARSTGEDVGEYTINQGSLTLMDSGDFKANNYTLAVADVKFTITGKTDFFSITGDPSKTYDGAVVTDPAVSQGESNGTVTYKYYTDASCTTETTTADGAEADGKAPKNAGNYWVKASIAASGNFAAVDAVKAFTISRLDISNATIALAEAPVYNGSEQSVTISSVKVGELDVIYNVKDNTDKATNVETKKVTIEGTGNFTGTAQSADWSLEKAAPKVDDFTIPALVAQEYTGSPITVAAPTVKGGITGMGTTITVKYAGSTDAPTAVNTSGYTITFDVTAGDNYEAATGLTYGTLIVNKKSIANKTVDDQIVRSNRETSGKTVELPALEGEATAYPESGTVTGNGLVASHSISGNTLTYSTASKAHDTNDTITITVPETTNYTSYTVTVKIVAKDKENLSGSIDTTGITGISGNIYDGEPIVRTGSATVTGRTNLDAELIYTYQGTDGTTYGLSTTAPTNAGTYKLIVSIPETNLDYTGSVEVPFTIEQRTITVGPGTYKVSKVYDGSLTGGAASGALAVGNIVSTDTGVSVTTAPVDYSNADVGGQTTMVVTLTKNGDDNGNYKLAAATVSVPCEITPKTISIDTVTGGTRNYVAGDTSAPIESVMFSGMVGGETLVKDTDYTVVGTMLDANAGTGKSATATVTLLATNYTLESRTKATTVDIAKAAAPALNNFTVTQKYTVTTEQFKEIGNAGMPADAGALTYTKGTADNSGSVTVSSWNVDSNGKVSFALTGGADGNTVTLPVKINSTNYEEATANVVVTLTAKDTPAATAEDITVTYTGSAITADKIVGTASVDGTWSFDGTPNLIDANGTGIEVTVRFTPTDDINYAEVTDTIKVIINKATPTGTPGYTKITTSGKTLADASLTTGNISVDGAIHWDLGDGTAVSANTSYNWTFVPEEATNYNNLTGSITVWSRSSGSGSSGTSTQTTKNPDGSTTTTTTNKNTGTVTETTKYPDGSIETVETKKDGTVTTTLTQNDGVKVDVVEAPGKEASVEINLPHDTDGTLILIPVDANEGTVAKEVKTGKIIRFCVPTKDGLLVKVERSTELTVISDNAKDFADTVGHWAEEAIDFVTARELYSGTSATTFTPDSAMTRAMLARVLHNLERNPSHSFDRQFADLIHGHWAADSIYWAAERGIVSGYPDGTYGADNNITREQLAVMLWRYVGSPSSSHDLSHFKDASHISSYAREALAWANEYGIVGGIGNDTLAPQGLATRSQVATMLMRMMKNYLMKY